MHVIRMFFAAVAGFCKHRKSSTGTANTGEQP